MNTEFVESASILYLIHKQKQSECFRVEGLIFQNYKMSLNTNAMFPQYLYESGFNDSHYQSFREPTHKQIPFKKRRRHIFGNEQKPLDLVNAQPNWNLQAQAAAGEQSDGASQQIDRLVQSLRHKCMEMEKKDEVIRKMRKQIDVLKWQNADYRKQNEQLRNQIKCLEQQVKNQQFSSKSYLQTAPAGFHSRQLSNDKQNHNYSIQQQYLVSPLMLSRSEEFSLGPPSTNNLIHKQAKKQSSRQPEQFYEFSSRLNSNKVNYVPEFPTFKNTMELQKVQTFGPTPSTSLQKINDSGLNNLNKADIKESKYRVIARTIDQSPALAQKLSIEDSKQFNFDQVDFSRRDYDSFRYSNQF